MQYQWRANATQHNAVGGQSNMTATQSYSSVLGGGCLSTSSDMGQKCMKPVMNVVEPICDQNASGVLMGVIANLDHQKCTLRL